MTSRLLAAAVVAVASLAAAPAAQAGWMTGDGHPPAWTIDEPCRNGMHWGYATFHYRQAWPIGANTVTIYDHKIVPVGTTFPSFPSPVSSGTYTVPRGLIVLLGQPYDYSAYFTFHFNRDVTPGQALVMSWYEDDPRPQLIHTEFGRQVIMSTAEQRRWTYHARDCRIARVVKPSRLAVLAGADSDLQLVAKSYLGVRFPRAGGAVSAREWFAQDADGDGDKDVVLDFPGLSCEPGQRIVLNAQPPSIEGC
jgi:hypothetical protein